MALRIDIELELRYSHSNDLRNSLRLQGLKFRGHLGFGRANGTFVFGGRKPT